jgi:hypothetical protein
VTPNAEEDRTCRNFCPLDQEFADREKFQPADLYIFLELNHALKIERRGDAETEPRYKNDARWAIQEALNEAW